jgi:glycine cleavage system H protein
MSSGDGSELRLPEHLRYGPEHEWSEVAEDQTVTMGITDFAQDQLGDVQWVGLPDVGADVERGSAFIEVESTKTSSEVFAPCSGTVLAINESLVNAPEQVNEDPYAAWFVKIRPADATELDALVDAAAYRSKVEPAG